jgi:hypothetical protein
MLCKQKLKHFEDMAIDDTGAGMRCIADQASAPLSRI